MIDTIEVHDSGYRSPEECERELTFFLSGATTAERMELFVAGVAQHTVDSLFPLDFERLAAIAAARFTHDGFRFRGGEHLNHTVIPQAEWMENIDVIKEVRSELQPESRVLYEAEWNSIFPGMNTAVSSLSQSLYHNLCAFYHSPMADDLAGWYVRSLFMAYWLLRHPLLAQSSTFIRGSMDSIMVWVAERLLARDEDLAPPPTKP